MLKILFAIPSLSFGGAETVVKNIVNNLDPHRFDVTLVTFYPGDKAVLRSHVKHFVMCKTSKWDFLKLKSQLERLFENERFDVVIGFLNYANILVSLARSSRKTTKLVLSVRNNPLRSHRYNKWSWVENFLLRKFYRNADMVTTNSLKIRDIMKNEFSIPDTNVANIYNPVDLKAIELKSREEVSHPFFSAKNLVVLGVGRLTYQKRFDRLIRIFSKISKDNEMARLIIIGQGEDEALLRKLIQESGLGEKVDLPGRQSNPYAWMAKSSLFVLSSDYEGFPNTVLESMVCGVPVVSVDCPFGPSEIIRNGHDGFLVPVDDEDALAKRVKELLLSEAMRKQFSDNAKQTVQKFSIENIIPQYEMLIEELSHGKN